MSRRDNKKMEIGRRISMQAASAVTDIDGIPDGLTLPLSKAIKASSLPAATSFFF